MRILHGITRTGGAGAERQMRNLVCHLSGGKYRHSVFSFASGNFEADLTESGASVNIQPLGGKKLPLALRAILAQAQAERVDALQSWDPQFDVLMGLAARRLRRPFIGSERNCALQYDLPEGYGKAWFRHLRAPVLRRAASVVIANSRAGQAHIESITRGATRSVLIRNGIDLEQLDAQAAEPVDVPNEPYIIVSNRLNGPKRTAIAIDLFEALRVEHPDLRLLVLGTGPQETELKARVAAKGLDGAVTFVGYQTNPLAYVRRSQAFLSASIVEGMPNSVIEAMALGVPVMLSNIAPHEELVEDSDGGALTYDADRPGLAARELAEFLSSGGCRSVQVQKAQRFARALTIPRMVEAFEGVYGGLY